MQYYADFNFYRTVILDFFNLNVVFWKESSFQVAISFQLGSYFDFLVPTFLILLFNLVELFLYTKIIHSKLDDFRTRALWKFYTSIVYELDDKEINIICVKLKLKFSKKNYIYFSNESYRISYFPNFQNCSSRNSYFLIEFIIISSADEERITWFVGNFGISSSLKVLRDGIGVGVLVAAMFMQMVVVSCYQSAVF